MDFVMVFLGLVLVLGGLFYIKKTTPNQQKHDH